MDIKGIGGYIAIILVIAIGISAAATVKFYINKGAQKLTGKAALK